MISYPLQIVTADGIIYDEEAVMIKVRTINGDIAVRARHTDLITALGMGIAVVDITPETRRCGACIGGLLAVLQGRVKVVATTFEWAEDIDITRAEKSKATAVSILASATASDNDKALAKARQKRAEIRIAAAGLAYQME